MRTLMLALALTMLLGGCVGEPRDRLVIWSTGPAGTRCRVEHVNPVSLQERLQSGATWDVTQYETSDDIGYFARYLDDNGRDNGWGWSNVGGDDSLRLMTQSEVEELCEGY